MNFLFLTLVSVASHVILIYADAVIFLFHKDIINDTEFLYLFFLLITTQKATVAFRFYLVSH